MSTCANNQADYQQPLAQVASRGLVALGVLLMVAAQAGAAPSPLQILQRAMNLAAQIKDYTATIEVTVKAPGVDIPKRTATVYFKRPDKIHIKSQSLVMLPRRALTMGGLSDEIAKHAQVTLVNTTTVTGHPVYFLKVIPNEQRHGEERLLVWVRGDRWTVERVEVWAGNTQRMAVRWSYQLIDGKYWMPAVIVARVPGRLIGESAKAGTGTITVRFSQVTVNTGLPDSLFKEQE